MILRWFYPRPGYPVGKTMRLSKLLTLLLIMTVVIGDGSSSSTSVLDHPKGASSSLSSSSFDDNVSYDSNWESLDSRPLPSWFPNAKVGIFIHWGVFSVPAFDNGWFWWNWAGPNPKPEFVDFVHRTETMRFNYPDYAHRFDATLYNPKEWANIFAQAGAQYVVLNSKHHDGFCLWDSRNISTTWNWNAMEVGPRRDLVGELAQAIRGTASDTDTPVYSPQTKLPLKFGVYHSLFEWFNPMWLEDFATNFSSQTFVEKKSMPELYHLVNTYQPEIIWSDGGWPANSTYWKATEFLAWLATNSSVKDTVVWNDRWGIDTDCIHGSYWNCVDKYMPPSNISENVYYENAMTLDKNSWGLNRRSNATDYLTTKELLDTLVTTISRNGNLLVNVGPAADGTISPIMVDRLLEMGHWLSVNGQAVYGTRAWNVCSQESDGTVYYTRTHNINVKSESNQVLYASLTEWPLGNTIALSCPEGTPETQAYMLGLNTTTLRSKNRESGSTSTDGLLELYVEVRLAQRTTETSSMNNGITLQLPPLTPNLLPCNHVWVIAITGIGNL